MENAIVQNFWEQPFNQGINLNKLQSLLMKSYVKLCTGKFKFKCVKFTRNVGKSTYADAKKANLFLKQAIDLFV